MDFTGTNEQLCNALDHIASRKSTGPTDAAVCLEARARIAELEAERNEFARKLVESDAANLACSEKYAALADDLAKDRAKNARLQVLIERALNEAVADDMDDWFSSLRAALDKGEG